MNLSFRFLIFLIGTTPLAANAVERAFVEPTLGNQRISIAQAVPHPDGGWWLSGASAFGQGIVARVDSDFGVLAIARENDVRSLATLPDGGVLAYGSGCGMTRYDAGAALIWRRPSVPSTDCFDQAPVVVADGGFWGRTGFTVRRFSDDGVERMRVVPAALGFSEFSFLAPIAASTDVLLIGSSDDASPATRRARVVRLTSDGGATWAWEDTVANTSASFVVARTGDAVVVGVDQSSGQRLLFARLSLVSGAVLHRSARVDVGHVDALLLDRSQHPVVIDDDVAYPNPGPNGVFATRLDDAGGTVWRTRLTGFDWKPDARAVQGGGDDLWLTAAQIAANEGDGIVHLAADGSIASSTPNLGASLPGLGSDGRGGVDVIVARLHELEQPRPPEERHAFGAGGSHAQRAIVVETAADSGMTAWEITERGDAYLLDSNFATGRHAIQRRSTDGTLRWRVESPATEMLTDRRLAANDELVCTVARAITSAVGTQDVRVQCRDAGDGSVRWQRSIGTAANASELFVASLDVSAAGDVVVLFRPPGTATRRAVFDRDGNPVGTVDIPQSGRQLEFSLRLPAARTLLVFSGNGFSYEIRDRSGAVTVASGSTTAQHTPYTAATSPDGLVVIGTQGSGSGSGTVSTLHVFAANGTLLRTIPVTYAITDSLLIVDADTVYQFVNRLASSDVTVDRGRPDLVEAIRLSDGTRRWQTSLRVTGWDGTAFVPDARGTMLAAISTSDREMRTAIIDRATGAVLSERTRACDACFYVNARAYGDAGLTTMTYSVFDDAPRTITRFDDAAFTPPSALPIASAGVEGTWFADYTLGQGLLLDLDASRRNVFMSWFTFAVPGAPDFSTKPQRWFTLQGQIAPESTSAELKIFRSSNGAFDPSPTVQAQWVGDAILTFTSCRDGTLRYRFHDEQHGFESGAVTLTRVGAAADCATGASATAATTKVTDDGFGAAQTGTWLDPARSSQGLLLDFALPGAFLGAWFTYDPVLQSDDPHAQHWFTLQGALPAGDAPVVVPIYETIGGAFDFPYDVSTRRVGEATFTLTACDRITMAYRFDDHERVGTFRHRAGTMALQKFDGCGD